MPHSEPRFDPDALPFLISFRPPIKAARTQVFAALTELAHLARYLGDTDADMRKSGFIRWTDPFGGLPVHGEILEFLPGEGFVVRDADTGGLFAYRLVERLGRTAVDARFYSEAPQPREVLDRIARRTAWQLAALKHYLERGERLDAEAWLAAQPRPAHGPRVLRRSELVFEPSAYPDDPETTGEYASLTRPLAATQMGADILRLQPGERNCRNHAETDEEEAFLVLSGRCKVEVEGKVHALETGDFVLTFPGDAHFFFNDSDAPCEILGFGGPDKLLGGAVYPQGKDAGWRDRVAGG